MKKIKFLVPFTLAAAVAMLSGCGKSEDSADASSDKKAAPKKAAPVVEERGEEFDLIAKWPEGKQVKQRVQINMDIATTVGGKTGPQIQNNLTLDLAHSLAEEKNEQGGYNVEMEVLSKKLENKIGEAGWAFDSNQDRKEDSKNPIFKDLRKVVGGKVTYVTNKEGKVVKLEGYTPFIKKATRSVSRSSRGVIMGFYSEANIRQMALSEMGLPKGGVAVGDTWEETLYEPSQVGPLEAKVKYTFADWGEIDGKKVAVLDVAGVYKKRALPQRKGAPAAGGQQGGGNDGRGGEDESPGGDMGEGGDEAGMEDDRAREMEMADESGMDGMGAGGGGGGGASKPAESSEGPAQPTFGPGEIGRLTGKMYFDPEAGLVISTEGTQEMLFNANVQGRSISSSQKFTVTTEILEVADAPKE